MSNALTVRISARPNFTQDDPHIAIYVTFPNGDELFVARADSESEARAIMDDIIAMAKQANGRVLHPTQEAQP